MSEGTEAVNPEESIPGRSLEEDSITSDSFEKDLKFSMCKYCRGSKKKNTIAYCSKICSETNKMVPSESFNNETGQMDTKEKFTLEKEWSYYKEVIKDKAAPMSAFTQNLTKDVIGLEAGMKLECLDVNNPVNYCVATIIEIQGHRICLRYDGFGPDSSHDFWLNFQAEELFPIGWCLRKTYHLQPPTGISCSHNEWKEFLSKTLTGALAAPLDLFKKPDARRQLRCHSFCPGEKVEVIHPERPDLIVPAVISKSLGPYYFLVTTEPLPTVPSATFYGYADCPGVYQFGWCESRGLELEVPSNPKEIRMRIFDPVTDSGIHKRNRMSPFKVFQKVEALDKDVVRVATVAAVFDGKVALIVFDGLQTLKFIDKQSLDVYPIGWCEKTKIVLYTPYGPVDMSSPTPTIGLKQKQSKKNDVNSASFSSFQKANSKSSPVKVIITDDKSSSSSQSQENEDQEPTDADTEGPTSPPSPGSTNTEASKKCDIDRFIVWLLNRYEYNDDDSYSVLKPDLFEAYGSICTTRLSPRWFTLVYKLFPGVSTIRRNIDGRFVNCLKKLKESHHAKTSGLIYVKDALEFLKSLNFLVQLGSNRLVTYLGLGDKYVIPEDSQTIFTTSKAPEGSNVFVISCKINEDDFTLSNFVFNFERTPCSPPLQSINTIEEFRATFKLCKQATVCEGVEYQPSSPSVRHGSKIFRGGRVYSMACNLVAYPHKGGNLCIHCKNIRGKCTTASAGNTQSADPIAEILDESLGDDIDDVGVGRDDEEHNPAFELKIYFNKSCYAGIYLNPDKVRQIAPHTQQEKPPQALKYLIERLIEISVSKERLSEILEAGFGTRIFNKNKDKVVKKGLFRFNTRNKVLRFIRRLMKRLNCCESFLTLEPTPCQHFCRADMGKSTKKESFDAVDNLNQVTPSSSHLHLGAGSFNTPSSVHQIIGNPLNKMSPGQIVNTPQGNVQVLYQLPPGSSSISSPVTLHAANQNHPHQRPHEQQNTQFYLPNSGPGNVTYMVVSNHKDKVGSPLPSATGNLHHQNYVQQQQQQQIGPPQTNVTQMMANITKTNLVVDIDDPSSKQHLNNTANNKFYVNQNATWTQQPLSHHQQQQRANNAAGPNNSNYSITSNIEPMITDENSAVRKHTGMRTLTNDQLSPNSVLNYQDNSNRLSHNVSQTVKYPQIQSVTSYADQHSRVQYDSLGRPVAQSGEKTQQQQQQKIHVHKVHHGNARVKYVEFKPVQDPRNNNENIQQHRQHPRQQQQQQNRGYNQNVYYNHQNLNAAGTQQHLTVHTPGQVPKSPLHSPPALRPPPAVPSRSIVLNSPPSLVPSPDVRPRFEFAGNNNVVMGNPTNTNAKLQGLPVHAKQMIIGQPQKTINIVNSLQSQNPKTNNNNFQTHSSQIPPSGTSPIGHQGNAGTPTHHGKKVIQATRVLSATDGSVNVHGKQLLGSNSGISATSTTVTVTMTYFPIQTSSQNKFVYVPVNSLQTELGQPVVLYQQQNAAIKTNITGTVGGGAKPVILSPQIIQGTAKSIMVVSKADHKDNNINTTSSTQTFTTVRIQQGAPQSKTPVAVHTPSGLKTIRYQLGQNTPRSGQYQQQQLLHNEPTNGIQDQHIQNAQFPGFTNFDYIKEENPAVITIKKEESTPKGGLVNGDPSQNTHGSGIKRKIAILSADHEHTTGLTIKGTQLPDENLTPDGVHHQKKRRGRPPSALKIPTTASTQREARTKMSMTQNNPSPRSPVVNPITLVNRVLTETYYKKQQQAQNCINYIEEPLERLPGLPNNPELWTPDDVYKFLMGTDCAQYAESLKEEEMDGKSFLLLTREALMEFKGFRLGPALKIVGYATYLRAKQRMLSMPTGISTQFAQSNNFTNINNQHNNRNSIGNNTVNKMSNNLTGHGRNTNNNSDYAPLEKNNDSTPVLHENAKNITNSRDTSVVNTTDDRHNVDADRHALNRPPQSTEIHVNRDTVGIAMDTAISDNTKFPSDSIPTSDTLKERHAAATTQCRVTTIPSIIGTSTNDSKHYTSAGTVTKICEEIRPRSSPVRQDDKFNITNSSLGDTADNALENSILDNNRKEVEMQAEQPKKEKPITTMNSLLEKPQSASATFINEQSLLQPFGGTTTGQAPREGQI